MKKEIDWLSGFGDVEERPHIYHDCLKQQSHVGHIKEKSELNNYKELAESYRECKKIVISAGFKREIEWQNSVSLTSLTERKFLQEHAWVTLSAGMKEQVIRNLFQRFSNVFFDWIAADAIVSNSNSCRDSALEIFRNKNKINAILITSKIISTYGFPNIKRMIMSEPYQTLRKFPYIGPITYYHLAKNIGIPVAKPDRHLSRLASDLGFSNVQELCSRLSDETGDRIQVVDLVLWRYATITNDYVLKFKEIGK